MFICTTRISFTLIKLAAATMLSCSFPVLAHANTDTTFDIGLGLHYSGLGINAGIHDDENTFLGSLGRISYSSIHGSTCGVGATWLSSYFFSNSNNADKHATSLYIGIVGSEWVVDGLYYDYEPVYGASVGYNYFFNGRQNNGCNVGFAFSYGDAIRAVNFKTLLQVGYQF